MKHRTYREGDETVCSCGLRWGLDEVDPHDDQPRMSHGGEPAMESHDSGVCYQCDKRVPYIFDDGRCATCTRLTPDEVRGE